MASFVTATSRSSLRSLKRLRNGSAAFWLSFDGRKKRRCFGCLFSAPAFVMAIVRAGEASISMRALGSVSIATEIHRCEPALDLERGCREPAYAEGPHPTGKGVGVGNFRLVPTTRPKKRSPPLEIHLWG